MSNIPSWYVNPVETKYKAAELRVRARELSAYVDQCVTELGKKLGAWAVECMRRELGRLTGKEDEAIF